MTSGKLRAFLQDKRYFVIVDDIWSTDAWELVKSALPENNLNSRIVTTTRITNVATSCCSSLEGYVHNIQPLSDEHSQKLFIKIVFGDTSACPPHLEEISHGILEKCHGLPLAIITVASLLAGKSNKHQWEQVYNSMSSAFSHQGMRDILLLSYYDLPHHLKTCLLYLSMFPEDYEIEREELIWRWIAEGFVTEVRGQTVDQIAENYFNELINRSLIQPVDIRYDGRAYACRVHDMVLDLIVLLSAEENFVSIVEGQSHNGGGRKIRRLSVQSKHVGGEVMQDIMDKCSQVRSISFYGCKELGIPHLQKLHSLRVLVSNYYSPLGNEHIKFIGSMFQLKFLRISCLGITELPEEIGDLKHLQTLDIRVSGIAKLPPSIGRLQKLVRLLVGPCVKLPDEIGYLQALQELSTTSIFSIRLMEALRCLTRLKTVGIYLAARGRLISRDMARYKEALKSSLAALHGLQSLVIGNCEFMEELMDILCCTVPYLQKLVVGGDYLTRLPEQMVSLVHLTYLYLCVARFIQGDLCILGDIPALLCSALSYTWSMPLMNGLPSAASNSGALRSLRSIVLLTEVGWRCCFYRMRCQSSEGYVLVSERRK
ncbi:disease resistance protein RGA5-like isoform X1 [Panicum virgatum]|uniref:disease resistance protein RGA5-like isoform X1 n=1 Tax=Panicum virgatum TaxID=38727 RepID=UPI0019D5A5DE|nr:disease resistance protein RGA5-like isoform X1 [Panicum virgatum]